MKKYKRIVLAGGNGYLGSVLVAYYQHLSEEVIILSRKFKPEEGNIRTQTIKMTVVRTTSAANWHIWSDVHSIIDPEGNAGFHPGTNWT